MHIFTPQTTTVQLDLIRKSLQNCAFLNTVVERCSLTTFAEDTKPSGEVDTWGGRASLQEDPDRLEDRANKNLTKFSKFSKVLHLEKQNPGVQHRLGSTCVGSSSVERDVVDTKLSVREQGVSAAESPWDAGLHQQGYG